MTVNAFAVSRTPPTQWEVGVSGSSVAVEPVNIQKEKRVSDFLVVHCSVFMGVFRGLTCHCHVCFSIFIMHVSL